MKCLWITFRLLSKWHDQKLLTTATNNKGLIWCQQRFCDWFSLHQSPAYWICSRYKNRIKQALHLIFLNFIFDTWQGTMPTLNPAAPYGTTNMQGHANQNRFKSIRSTFQQSHCESSILSPVSRLMLMLLLFVWNKILIGSFQNIHFFGKRFYIFPFSPYEIIGVLFLHDSI